MKLMQRKTILHCLIIKRHRHQVVHVTHLAFLIHLGSIVSHSFKLAFYESSENVYAPIVSSDNREDRRSLLSPQKKNRRAHYW